MLKFKTGPWEKKKEILSTLGSPPAPTCASPMASARRRLRRAGNLSLMDKKFGVSLENSLVPMKTVSLVSGQILSKVRTAKNSMNPEGKQASYGAGKTEIEQSLARSQSRLRR